MKRQWYDNACYVIAHSKRKVLHSHLLTIVPQLYPIRTSSAPLLLSLPTWNLFFSSYLTNVILRQFSFALIELGRFKTTPEKFTGKSTSTLHWRHNDHDGVWNHQPHDFLLNCLFRRRSKKTSKLRVAGLCVGKSPETTFFHQRVSNIYL